MVAVVQLHPDARRPQLGRQRVRLLQHPRLPRLDRDHHHLVRRNRRWQPQAALVAVHHDHGSHKARGGAPRRRVGMVLGAVPSGVGDPVGARELVPQIVGRRRLQRLAVAHHCLGRKRLPRAREPLGRALSPQQRGHRQHRALRVGVDLVQDPQALRHRLLLGLVSGVPLLPQELAGAQEQPRPQLPPHHVRPLVVEHGQIAVGLQPAPVRAPDHRFGRRPQHQRLLQLRAAGLGHHGHLGREALDQVGLLRQHRGRDQHREVEVLVAGGLDAIVHLALQQLPDRVPVRLDHHHPAHGRVLGQAGPAHDVGVPGGKVVLD